MAETPQDPTPNNPQLAPVGNPSPDPTPTPAADPAAAIAPEPAAPAAPANPTPAAADPAPADPAAVDPWASVEDADLKAFIGDKSPADIAKELHGAQALIGKKTVGIPTDESKPEEWAAYHEARGVPKEASGYDFSAVLDKLAEDHPGLQRDEARETRYKELFKAANLSQNEANEMVRRELTGELEKSKGSIEAAAKVSQETSDLITKEWGPDKEAKTGAANRFFNHVGIDGDALDVLNGVLGSKPEARFKILNMAAEQGALLQEGGALAAGASPTSAGMSPAQAGVAKSAYIAQGDNKAAYTDPTHPNHAAVTAQMTQYLMIEQGRTK